MVGSGKGRRPPHEGLDWTTYGPAFGDRVRTLRRHRELSQEQLADASGISRNSIQGIETRHHRGTPTNPRLDTVYRIALALGVPPEVLLPDGDQLVKRTSSQKPANTVDDIAWPEQYLPLINKAAGVRPVSDV